jgi:acyl-CoA reductase-like NAD-dependent aldehyde dehydrogenase
LTEARTFDVVNPADESVVTSLAVDAPAQVEAAIRAARAAFDVGAWPTLSFAERAGAVRRWADVLAARRDELVALAIAETGCPVWLAESTQIQASIDDMRIYADLALSVPSVEHTPARVAEHVSSQNALRVSLRQWEPIGVVAAFVPYNYPLYTAVMKVVPALLAGCPVVMRPSPLAPLVAMEFVAAAHEAGIPGDVVQVVVEPGIEGARLLCSHDDVDLVSFTGSTRVGRDVAAQCATSVKRVVLELGGKGAQVHLPDVFDDDAGVEVVTEAVRGVWLGFSGQACTAPARVLVPEAVVGGVLERLAVAAGEMVLGDPRDRATQMGPVISAQQREHVLQLIRRTQAAGGELVAGGSSADVPKPGYYVAPTVLHVSSDGVPGAQEEFFGPCVTVQGYGTVDEALRITNGTAFGLSNTVFGRDLLAATAFAARVRSGTVKVNGAWTDARTPATGIKQSGYGIERSELAMREFQFLKHVSLAEFP